ncbi:MAG: hypothetical protein A3B30_02530 [Candidatus Komeilibacteria bacterium RIFCSPLOWO2_01_FULL_52_15]|uniref:Glycoside hydrolase family 5 domain-containing protein n=1 Tax=Candidatus Komeilibacteria bacterium RIFCSPLOWO2_01_FULL_52_15 TaxID=1798551 RepID=A0A1G2BS47_9BACT|nr:MAG: hypothetical protein A3B30_02530 [Candidatus Komeilibacteria bacterium RIFCSPLOWO2_01_FULL_52_15]
MIRRRNRIALVTLVVGMAWLFWYLKFAAHQATLQLDAVPDNFWGVTFSKKYAEELGLDWRQAYLAVIDDLQARNIRLPVYWDQVETSAGAFDFTDYDWMLAEGAKRKVRFVLAVGRRLPRWPECHTPAWLSGAPETDVDRKQAEAVERMIEHFKPQESIRYWQIENEYFFPWFGLCPKANRDLIREEISYLKKTDPRPIVLTDSGELNSWRDAAAQSDILGITIYRIVWNNYFGYFRWPWPAALYRFKARLAGKSQDHMMVAELQAEPWPSQFRSLQDLRPDEARALFPTRQLETNSEIARRTGFTAAYYWGVEWWYWMKQKGIPEYWDSARNIIQHANR